MPLDDLRCTKCEKLYYFHAVNPFGGATHESSGCDDFTPTDKGHKLLVAGELGGPTNG